MSDSSPQDSLERARARLSALQARYLSGDVPSAAEASDELEALAEELTRLTEERASARGAYRVADRMRAMGVSTAGLAHELRSPLSAMSMQAQVSLMRRDLDETSRKDFEGMLAGIKRMTAMVTTAVEFAEPSVLRRPISIADVVGRIEPFFKVRLRQSEVELCVELDTELPAVRGIDVELAQVLIHLLDNAVRAAEAKGGPGQVVLRARSHEGGLRLEVEDSGVGIPESLRPSLFESFSSGREGFGLGLALARQLAEEHGGSLELESAAEPTRFVLRLPGA